MALTRDYHSTHYTTTMSSHRHPKPPSFAAPPTTSSSSSSPPPPGSSSSHHHHHHPPAAPAAGRRRRGRQARPSQLSHPMRRACRKFADRVGAPNVVEPAGFRDFRGWLSDLASRDYRGHWDELLATIAKELDCNPDALHALKEDIVREIIKCVVVPRPEESAKLVSTNAGRQASRPKSGTTLMVVLDHQLARVDKKLPQLVNNLMSTSSASTDHPMSDVSDDPRRRHHRSSGAASGSNRSRSTSGTPLGEDRLPSVSDLLGHRSNRSTLPSFQELDASLKRRTGGSSSSRR